VAACREAPRALDSARIPEHIDHFVRVFQSAINSGQNGFATAAFGNVNLSMN
jgi:2,4-dienoyl-CoA reductase-like NADH-dependent reductase (Old Yellow Enzyme family)